MLQKAIIYVPLTSHMNIPEVAEAYKKCVCVCVCVCVGGGGGGGGGGGFTFQLASWIGSRSTYIIMCFALHCLLVSSLAPEYRRHSKPGLVKTSPPQI